MEKKGSVFKREKHGMNMEAMRLSKTFSDVSIKTRDKVLRGHRVVLAANLNYFRSAFASMPGGNQQVIIYLRDFDGEYVESILTFAYTGEILLSDQNVIMILKLALELKEEDVVQACITYLKSHLKPEQACKVYEIATVHQFFSLKKLARSAILDYFQDCSESQDFLSFTSDNLTNILSRVIPNYPAPHRVFFEGIILWILKDLKSRQMYIYTLLNCIDMTEFDTPYLLNYIEDHRYSSIVDEIFHCYDKQLEKKKHEEVLSEHRSLILVGKVNGNLQVQYYSHFLKKWCEPREIINPYTYLFTRNGTILNKNCYSLIVDKNCPLSTQVKLAEFSTCTSSNVYLNSSSELLRSSAVCASLKYVYLCGGQYDDESPSDRVIRYNPQTKVFKNLLSMPTKRYNATATFSNGCLYVIGGCSESADFLGSVEVYNTSSKEWSEIETLSTPRVGFAAAVLEDKLYVAGGIKLLKDGRKRYSRSVLVYSSSSGRWQSVARLSRYRFKFAMIGYEGKLLIVGGELEGTRHETIEVYDPNKDEWKEDSALSKDVKLKRPIIGLY